MATTNVSYTRDEIENILKDIVADGINKIDGRDRPRPIDLNFIWDADGNCLITATPRVAPTANILGGDGVRFDD
jgi:hypothetical protein